MFHLYTLSVSYRYVIVSWIYNKSNNHQNTSAKAILGTCEDGSYMRISNRNRLYSNISIQYTIWHITFCCHGTRLPLTSYFYDEERQPQALIYKSELRNFLNKFLFTPFGAKIILHIFINIPNYTFLYTHPANRINDHFRQFLKSAVLQP